MKIYWLLIFVPLAIGARLLNAPPTFIFVFAFFGLIPLAALLSESVEMLALYTGPGIGALLTATFGTLTELFILFNLLRSNQLAVMQAEIAGSVLMGLVLVIGLSEVFGGVKHGLQVFDSRNVSLATSLMALAVIGMLVPTFFGITEQLKLGTAVTISFDDPALNTLSHGVSIALVVLYALYLVFIFRYLPNQNTTVKKEAEVGEEPEWSLRRALALIALATLGVAIVSGILTDALEPFGESVGLSTLFLGIILLPIAGGFPDILVSVRAARNNHIDLSFSLTTSAVLQTALFVAPLMVLVSPLFGVQFTLYFAVVEVVAMGLAVAVASLAANDRYANWFEGAQFLTLYIILALWFYLIS